MKSRPKKATAAPRHEKFAAKGRSGILSPRRKWLFRFGALAGLPLALVCGLELILRLAGCGYETGFFERVRIGNRDYFVNNEDFSLRFFPPQLARWPEPVMFEAAKPADTYRIFILGESAAQGEPDPNYAASRYMQTLLAERFPNTRFEVINTGVTAIDSHVILPVARDCARGHGDLWILYMGNNEMVGPFGAATVFGAQAPPIGLARLYLTIQQTRLGQWLCNVARMLHGRNPNESWGGMEMFLGNRLGAEDPRRERVYRNFKRNLEDIVQAGLGSGAGILLNTVAVNLKDCPPFASLTNANLSAGDAAAFANLFSNAVQLERQGDATAAAEKFSAAAKLDPRHAELQYRWGECQLASADFAGAREHFQRACDDDALPFRADSLINGIIQKTGRQFAGGKLALFDAAAALAANTPDGICGQETFYEHVHFNPEGNFRLGRAWADQVAKMLPAGIARAARTNVWAARETCERLLALTDWNRCAEADMMMDWLRRPPLSSQSNNAKRIQLLQEEDRELRRRFNPVSAQEAEEIYQASIHRAPQDPLLRENFAEFLEFGGDLKQAAAQWQKEQELMPYSCKPFYQAGRLLSELEQWVPAQEALTKAVRLRPRLAEGWYELGGIHLATDQLESALRDYNRARELEPRNAAYCAYAGKTLSKLNRHAEAVPLYRHAIELQPDLWEAHFALGDELGAARQFTEAGNEYEQVIRLRPDIATAHLNRGIMLAALGRSDEARQEFQETLRLQPDNRQARQYVGQLKDSKK